MATTGISMASTASPMAMHVDTGSQATKEPDNQCRERQKLRLFVHGKNS
jgi:hypothetical protein